MDQAPYESPRGVADRAKQAFPWKWLVLGGVLTSLLSYLAIVALILSGETSTGIRMSRTGIAVAQVLLGLSVVGSAAAIIAASGWLLSWVRRFTRDETK